jgi:5,10-methylenetetrahydromethanopterin reductase
MATKLALMLYSVLRIPIDDIIACSIAAEEAGFTHITVAESFYRDAFALASGIASRTTKIRFGTCVMPIYTRTPFQLAIGTSTLNELSHGRFDFLGLGIGYRSRTEQFFGIHQSRRVERMTEYVEVIRALLSETGTNTSYHGKLFNFEKFPRLAEKPLDAQIFFGTSGGRMLGLAGRIADGVILNSISTPSYMAFAREKLAEGARSAGRDPSRITLGHSIIYAVDDNSQQATDAAKEDILFYLSYPELDPVVERSDFAAPVKEMRRLYSAGDKKGALAQVSDEMLENFAVYGTPKECRRRLQKFVKSRKIDIPVIRVSMTTYKGAERREVFMRAIESLSNWAAN